MRPWGLPLKYFISETRVLKLNIYSYCKRFWIFIPAVTNLKLSKPWNSELRYFTKGNFPRVFFQVATSQMYVFQSGNFSNVHFPEWQLPKWQLPHEEKVATSQMYVYPSNNFPSVNFPMKEKRQLPTCTFFQVSISINNSLYFL